MSIRTVNAEQSSDQLHSTWLKTYYTPLKQQEQCSNRTRIALTLIQINITGHISEPLPSNSDPYISSPENPFEYYPPIILRKRFIQQIDV